MNIRTSKEVQDIHTAEIERSLDQVAKVWESNEVLSVDDMCKHLEAVIDVMDGKSDFNQFVESSNLTSHVRLN